MKEKNQIEEVSQFARLGQAVVDLVKENGFLRRRGPGRPRGSGRGPGRPRGSGRRRAEDVPAPPSRPAVVDTPPKQAARKRKRRKKKPEAAVPQPVQRRRIVRQPVTVEDAG